jgi:flagellar biosynthetic protein FliR
MTTLSLLDHFVLSQLFTFLLVFCRIGSALMFVPGFSDSTVPTRVRLHLALAIAVLLTPFFLTIMPAPPKAPLALGVLLLTEITTGIAMGLVVRIILTATHVAGTLIAMQSSLAVASQFDPNSGAQSPVVSNLLVLTGVVCFFALDMHHLLLKGLVASYVTFPVGGIIETGDFSETIARTASDAFAVGAQLSAPHLVFSLLLYLGGGVIARLMPQMQVFFILMPLQIVLAFVILIAVLSGMLMVYSGYINDALMQFFQLEGL